MAIAVHSTSDPALALAAGEPLLLARPDHNNIILSVLDEQIAQPGDGRYWWASRGDAVVGFAMQSPPGSRAVVATVEREVVGALADTIAVDAPDLPGVMAQADPAAAFAGRWAEVRHVPAGPVQALRLHRIDTVHHPEGVPGTFRSAGEADRDVLLGWTAAFQKDIESDPFNPGPRSTGGAERRSGALGRMDRALVTGRQWLWEVDGEPVSMAALKPTASGVARVVLVYTPPEHRRRSYAAACVAALSAQVLRTGATCVLHTQLRNPTSNSVYRRIGFVPLAEVLIYRFG